MSATRAPDPLPREHLRWICDPSVFDFETTRDVDPAEGVVGQDEAVEALQFGLRFHAPGQNIFVRGLTGTGRSSLVERLVRSTASPCPEADDRCYVYNFQKPDRPRLLTLPRGRGPAFRDEIDRLIQFVRKQLQSALAGDVVRAEVVKVEQRFGEAMKAKTDPFEAELKEAGYGMVTVNAGPTSRQLIVPLIDGAPMPPEALQPAREAGTITDEQVATWEREIPAFAEKMSQVGEALQVVNAERIQAIQQLYRDEARRLLDQVTRSVRSAYDDPGVHGFLDAVTEDVVLKRLGDLEENTTFVERYRVNVVLTHGADETCPVVLEHAPSVPALVGSIDLALDPEGDAIFAPQMMVRGGSVLQADGGFLVLDAKELLTERGAWRVLVRTLRFGLLEIQPPAGPTPMRSAFVKPEPIPVDVKVVLLGDARTWYLLDSLDPDFRDLFKVLADFDNVIPKDAEGLGYYASVVSRIAVESDLPPLTREAVAALCEHGARIAAQGGKLTARFGRLADLAREAGWLAERAGEGRVSGERVREAVVRTKRRANLPSRRFQEMIAKGVIRVDVQGRVVGQVNALAVIQAGQLTYGFPNRLTATIAPGRAGTINVEREAAMSGNIHTKGFLILEGLLRSLLEPDHPLTFSASIAFEQSYGGVDGDSASGVETVCLLSAMTDLPVRQDLAMTGAIDQVGNILPIGGANEKIEGFYDACAHQGLTGTQGVIIPAANTADLMLRHDVVAACAEGRFAVYEVGRIEQALELMLGQPAGAQDDEGRYPEGTVLGVAQRRARDFWKKAIEQRIPSV